MSEWFFSPDEERVIRQALDHALATQFFGGEAQTMASTLLGEFEND